MLMGLTLGLEVLTTENLLFTVMDKFAANNKQYAYGAHIGIRSTNDRKICRLW